MKRQVSLDYSLSAGWLAPVARGLARGQGSGLSLLGL